MFLNCVYIFKLGGSLKKSKRNVANFTEADKNQPFNKEVKLRVPQAARKHWRTESSHELQHPIITRASQNQCTNDTVGIDKQQQGLISYKSGCAAYRNRQCAALGSNRNARVTKIMGQKSERRTRPANQ